MNISEYIVNQLKEYGVKNIYGVTGGFSMYLTEAIRKSNINFIPTMFEQSAGIMAEADSIYNEDLSVLVTTAGPGIINAMTPISSAYIDGNQMLILYGQCKTQDSKYTVSHHLRQKGVQEVDVYLMLQPITKEVFKLEPNTNISKTIKQAIKIATSGKCGPVAIELPLDIQKMERNKNENYYSIYLENSKPLSYGVIDIAIDSLNRSRKPVLFLGNGIRKYRKDISKLHSIIEDLNIPVLTTWKSMDLIQEYHPLYCGRPGGIASRYSNMILQECDLLISIGSRLDLPSTAYNFDNFAKNAKKIIVDIDESELKKFGKNSIDNSYINEDGILFLEELHKNTDRIKLDNINWIEECKGIKNKYPIEIPESNPKYVNQYEFIDTLSKLCTDDIIVPSSSGSASEITCQAWKVKSNQRVICSNGLGSMGFAVSHGIGACIASGKKRTIVIEGDGSFFMSNTNELELLKRYDLPVKIFVWNNNGYMSIKNSQDKFFEGNLTACNEGSGLTLPDLKKVANSHDLEYICIENNIKSRLEADEETTYVVASNLESQIQRVLNTKGSVLCEVMICPELQTQPRVQSSVDKDGNIVSGVLENMWPFLGEDKE